MNSMCKKCKYFEMEDWSYPCNSCHTKYEPSDETIKWWQKEVKAIE